MALKLYNLRSAFGAKKKKKRVGRGDSSGHGTYSTRGAKGQRSRTGGKAGLKLRGLKSNIQSIPKLGGFKSFKPKFEIVNLKDLERKFAAGAEITKEMLYKEGLIGDRKGKVKILGEGKLTKKFIIKIDKISDSAKESVEKLGGKVILLNVQGKLPEAKKESI